MTALDRVLYLTRALFGPLAVLRLECGVFYAGTATHRLHASTLSELQTLLERHARTVAS